MKARLASMLTFKSHFSRRYQHPGMCFVAICHTSRRLLESREAPLKNLEADCENAAFWIKFGQRKSKTPFGKVLVWEKQWRCSEQNAWISLTWERRKSIHLERSWRHKILSAASYMHASRHPQCYMIHKAYNRRGLHTTDAHERIDSCSYGLLHDCLDRANKHIYQDIIYIYVCSIVYT